MKLLDILTKILIGLILLIIIGFNYHLYRAEFTVLSDPNDNIFHYALVDEAKNLIEQIAGGRLSVFQLLDSWNERWADGFALSANYAHLPQAAIAGAALIFNIEPYRLFVIVRTMLLILLPVMFFLAGAVLRLPMVYNIIIALFSQLIVTDGLYGIDASSFLWRGWGLTAQLYALFFLPLAFAYSLEHLENKRHLWKAVIFNFIVAQAHFGIFYILMISYPIYMVFSMISDLLESLDRRGLLADFRKVNKLWELMKNQRKAILEIVTRGLWLAGLVLLCLSYFALPYFLDGKYRNFSLWDAIWKFDSWGIKQVLTWFLNGDLFDYKRFPLITLAIIFGGFYGLLEKRKLIRYLVWLFLFYFVLFFGRTTLGGLIDLLPGFSEYHLHRLVVMVQVTGVLVGGWFIYLIINGLKDYGLKIYQKVESLNSKLQTNTKSEVLNSKQDKVPRSTLHVLSYQRWIWRGLLIIVVCGLAFLIYRLEKPVIQYARDNEDMIRASNSNYLKDSKDYQVIVERLKQLPKGRVYAGRPGNWGREFKIGDTQVYMALSRDGFAVIGFLPQSWSPNSDAEQFFNENDRDFYNLYNVRYLVYPDTQKPPEFAQKILKSGPINLYQVETNGWYVLGKSNLNVRAKKTELINIVRLWFGSQAFRDGIYPQISLDSGGADDKLEIKMAGLNRFEIINNQGVASQLKSIWQVNPFIGLKNDSLVAVEIKESRANEVFGRSGSYSAQVKLPVDCPQCLLVLKQTYHPNWRVKVNGEGIKPKIVMPFYIGIPLEKKGDYLVSAEYRPGSLKLVLFWLSIFGLIGLLIWGRKQPLKD